MTPFSKTRTNPAMLICISCVLFDFYVNIWSTNGTSICANVHERWLYNTWTSGPHIIVMSYCLLLCSVFFVCLLMGALHEFLLVLFSNKELSMLINLSSTPLHVYLNIIIDPSSTVVLALYVLVKIYCTCKNSVLPFQVQRDHNHCNKSFHSMYVPAYVYMHLHYPTQKKGSSICVQLQILNNE